MVSRIYNSACAELLKAYLVTGADVRAALLMTNTTVDTENDAIVYVDDITTLDECDGANYVRKALADEVANVDDTNDRGEFDATDLLWTSLGAGTRSIQGVLLYQHVNDDTDSKVIAWIEFAAPVAADGNNFQVQWDGEGIIQAEQA